jgi:hypothetical protein
MRSSHSRRHGQVSHSQPPAIESLESRTLLSSSGTPALLVTVPGPIPASAVAGAKVNDHVKVNIANDGTGKFSGRTTVTLYASPNGILSNTDAQLGTVTRSLGIRAGTSKNVVIVVHTLPQNLDGDYFVLANVIAPTQTVEGVSATAVVVSPAHVDLSNAITSVPGIGHLGHKINVTLDVTNLGNETAKGTLDTLFELSVNIGGSNPFQVATLTKHINLKAGGSVKLHLSVPVALGSPSGNQFIVAVLDPNDLFNDSNLANNTAISAAPVSFR